MKVEKYMEEWKDIEDYEGIYQVSNMDRVKSVERIDSLGHHRKEKILKPSYDNDGYKHYTFCKNGKIEYIKSSRLVAKHFIPNPDNLPQVNHKNECTWDDRASNLEWCSSSYNCNYGTRNKRMSEKKRNNLKESFPVKQYTKNGEYIKTYPSLREAERQTGIEHHNISKCCKGRRESAGGFKWKYA